jgi:hypothetical protein
VNTRIKGKKAYLNRKSKQLIVKQGNQYIKKGEVVVGVCSPV